MAQRAYSPPAQREVASSIYSTAGWINGSFLLPKLRGFTEYLNQQQDFLKLKDVQLPGLEKEIPFFAIQRHAIVFIVPTEPEELALHARSMAGERKSREISCAFTTGVVSGTLDLLPGTRVSDFLMQKHMFFYLRNCSLFLRTTAQPQVRHEIAVVIVNATQIIGVSEPRFV